MKESFESFIVKCLDKLDSTTMIIVLPCALILYVCIFIPNEDIEKTFGISNKVETIKKTVKCPECGKEFEVIFRNEKDTI